MLDALIHRQDGHVAGATQTTVIKKRLEVSQHLGGAVGAGHHPVDEIWAGKAQILAGNGLGFMR